MDMGYGVCLKRKTYICCGQDMAFSAMYLLDAGMVSGRLSGYRFVPPAFGTGCCENIRCAFHFVMLSFHLLLDFCNGTVRLTYPSGNDYSEKILSSRKKPVAFCA